MVPPDGDPDVNFGVFLGLTRLIVLVRGPDAGTLE
jgi:hypothetical protein